MDRRTFTQLTGTTLAGSLLASNALGTALTPTKKKRVAMVGTGHRGLGMWGVEVLKEHADKMEFVGLCDRNPGRVETGKKMLGVRCPTFTDFDKMMKEVKREVLIVTTVDATHHEFIVKGMEYGADIVT